MSIKVSSNPLKPLVLAAFLAAPLVSAWAWNNQRHDLPAYPATDDPTTQRLPVEIIASETQPQWVLVPIDPS